MHNGTLRWATAKRSGCVIQKFNELLQDFGVFVRRIAPLRPHRQARGKRVRLNENLPSRCSLG